jgi:hypothetical protein
MGTNVLREKKMGVWQKSLTPFLMHNFFSKKGRRLNCHSNAARCDYYPVHLLVIPMYICTSQSLFSHSYVVNE